MNDTTRILIGWELGAALGHVASLGRVARALVDRGSTVWVALRSLTGASRWMPPEARLIQAPLLPSRPPDGPQRTHADIYADFGWSHAELLAPSVRAWSELIELIRPDAVVVDSAPTLLLALRGRGVHTVGVNTPFATPPPVSPLPSLRWWAPGEDPTAADREAGVLDAANRARPSGAPALPRLADLFDGSRWLLKGPRALDPWATLRPASTEHLGTFARTDEGTVNAWPPGDGPRVFVYLKADYPPLSQVFAALERHGCRVLAYVAGSGLPNTPRRTMLSEPARIDGLLPSTELVVTHSALGTGCAFLEGGVPVLLLPTHLEQQAIARCASALPGVVAVPPGAVGAQLDRALRHALGEGFRAAARAGAPAIREPREPIERIVRAVNDPDARGSTPLEVR